MKTTVTLDWRVLLIAAGLLTALTANAVGVFGVPQLSNEMRVTKVFVEGTPCIVVRDGDLTDNSVSTAVSCDWSRKP